ncbi:RICIN domain-containing protein [Frankia sp. AgKG'84/4]|nr:RICIN domain-containing protein [Frankia sp. AgKG'84/4]
MLAPTTAHAAGRTRVEITNARSGLKADVIWGSRASYQGVFLWRNNTSASQEFDLLDSGDGYFRIRAHHSGQCLMLDDRAGTYRNGTRVVQNTRCAAGDRLAEWRRGRVDSPPQCSGEVCSTTNSSYQVLINRATGLCLDADNGRATAPREQAVLQQWDCIHSPDDWNAGNQIWRIGNEASL